MATVFLNGSSLFQKENVPCHTAKIAQEWVKEDDTDVKVLTWTFPDLSRIKLLWDVADKQVRSVEAPHCRLQDLKYLLLRSWCQLPQHAFRCLVESVPQSGRAFLAAQLDLQNIRHEVECYG